MLNISNVVTPWVPCLAKQINRLKDFFVVLFTLYFVRIEKKTYPFNKKTKVMVLPGVFVRWPWPVRAWAMSALSAGLTGSTLLSPRGNLGVPTSRATSPMAPLSLILRSLQAEKYTITTQYFYNSHFHQKFIFKIFFYYIWC